MTAALSDVELAAVARARRRLLPPAGHVYANDRTYLFAAQSALNSDSAAFPTVSLPERRLLGLLEEAT